MPTRCEARMNAMRRSVSRAKRRWLPAVRVLVISPLASWKWIVDTARPLRSATSPTDSSVNDVRARGISRTYCLTSTLVDAAGPGPGPGAEWAGQPEDTEPQPRSGVAMESAGLSSSVHQYASVCETEGA
jgi:hypothetical protein